MDDARGSEERKVLPPSESGRRREKVELFADESRRRREEGPGRDHARAGRHEHPPRALLLPLSLRLLLGRDARVRERERDERREGEIVRGDKTSRALSPPSLEEMLGGEDEGNAFEMSDGGGSGRFSL